MTVTILQGDCRERLREMVAGSVHSTITSPPYWGLRDYGLPPSIWGGRDDCLHLWGDEISKDTAPRRQIPHGDGRPVETDLYAQQRIEIPTTKISGQGQFCRLCGCWKGALGLEPTPALYVEHMVEVMREVWRVLRDDAVLFLNLGDSYAQASSRRGQSNSDHTYEHANTAFRDERYSGGVNISAKSAGVKPKDLIGIPWMVAFALRDDGWYLRSDIIWAKGLSFCPTYSGSVMPESVSDRPTSAYEHVFLLSKQKRYYYDAIAVREKSTGQMGRAADFARNTKDADVPGQGYNQHREGRIPTQDNGGRNLRNVWAINPHGFPGSHFATFPPKLIEPMIKAGTSERGCCPECGSPWVRVTEREQRVPWSERKAAGAGRGSLERGYNENHGNGTDHTLGCSVTTLGWTPTCECAEDGWYWCEDCGIREHIDNLTKGCPRCGETMIPAPYEPIPCTVLDPFGGAGTTALVARQLGRDAILIELSETYCQLARRRLNGTEEIEVTNGDGEQVTMEQAVMFGGVMVE